MITDSIGNPLAEGDLVSFVVGNEPFVGRIASLNTGAIARGLTIDNGKPTGQQTPPHIVVTATFNRVFLNPQNPEQMAVLRVVDPEPKVTNGTSSAGLTQTA
jgi:hypothetical protein